MPARLIGDQGALELDDLGVRPGGRQLRRRTPAAPPAVSGPASQVPTTTTAWVKLPLCRPSPTSLSSRASFQVPTTTTAWVKLRGGGRRPAAGTPAARPGWRARSGVVRAASAGCWPARSRPSRSLRRARRPTSADHSAPRRRPAPLRSARCPRPPATLRQATNGNASSPPNTTWVRRTPSTTASVRLPARAVGGNVEQVVRDQDRAGETAHGDRDGQAGAGHRARLQVRRAEHRHQPEEQEHRHLAEGVIAVRPGSAGVGPGRRCRSRPPPRRAPRQRVASAFHHTTRWRRRHPCRPAPARSRAARCATGAPASHCAAVGRRLRTGTRTPSTSRPARSSSPPPGTARRLRTRLDGADLASRRLLDPCWRVPAMWSRPSSAPAPVEAAARPRRQPARPARPAPAAVAGTDPGAGR